MDDITKRKLLAAGKVIGGTARIASGVATAFGVGLVGSFLKSHKMRTTAIQVARFSLEGGKKMLQNGLNEFKG